MKKIILIILLFCGTAWGSQNKIPNVNFLFCKKPQKLSPNEIKELRSIDSSNILHNNFFSCTYHPINLYETSSVNKYFMLKIEENNVWIGCAIFHKAEANNLFLDYLLVKEKYQRKGLGKKMIDTLFQECKPPIIRLESTTDAESFYAKLGFKEDIYNFTQLVKENPYLAKT